MCYKRSLSHKSVCRLLQRATHGCLSAAVRAESPGTCLYMPEHALSCAAAPHAATAALQEITSVPRAPLTARTVRNLRYN